MADLLVRSMAVKKGVEYAGIFPNGNSIRIFDGTKISVNRTPFLGTVNKELIKVSPSFTYDFEKDSVIGIYNVVNNNLERVYEHSCTTHMVVQVVEGGAICELVSPVAITKRGSTINCSAYIVNSSNKSVLITIRIKGKNQATGVEHDINQSPKIKIFKKSEKTISFSTEALHTKENEKIFFTLEADKAGCTVEGRVNPSIVRIVEQI